MFDELDDLDVGAEEPSPLSAKDEKRAELRPPMASERMRATRLETLASSGRLAPRRLPIRTEVATEGTEGELIGDGRADEEDNLCSESDYAKLTGHETDDLPGPPLCRETDHSGKAKIQDRLDAFPLESCRGEAIPGIARTKHALDKAEYGH